jgi:ribosomal protein S18 acetylase RimI-like enzyme
VVRVRPYGAADERAVVELSLRAWEPVFASMREHLGDELFELLRPDWRAGQAAAVAETCANPDMDVLVADVDGAVAGFVAFTADAASTMGIIEMLAVDPAHQRAGIASTLTSRATDALRERGMRTVMVETGGDAGHAPARGTYAKAGFTMMPIARYFKALHPARE